MRPLLALLLLATVRETSTAGAQPAPVAEPAVITLRPAAEPIPALKYRLVPERRTLKPGNAVVFYHRAILFLMQTRSQLAVQPKDRPGYERISEQTLARWSSGPIGEIPREKAKWQLATFQRVLAEVELAALQSTCDWEFDLRQEGVTLTLPEIQEMRDLSRLVRLRARLAILDGKTDEAMHWIEIGFVMGRHVSHGPVVIQALVGVAIESIMARCLEDLIQAPGTPSLYWALADRPRPLIDMRYPLEGERYLLQKELPELSAVSGEPWSLDQARRFTDELQRKLFMSRSGASNHETDGAAPVDLSNLGRRIGVAAMAAKVYPEARRALIAQGRPEARVEAMPVIQVATLYTLQEYERLRDDSYKWMNLPYWQSYDRVDQGVALTVEAKFSQPLLTLFRMRTPALNQARLAALRLDRHLDALQCIEAIRLHAAAHNGKLPLSLEAITDAPVPINPVTGKPFHYELNGDSASLSTPVPPGGPDHPSYAIHYVLKLAH